MFCITLPDTFKTFFKGRGSLPGGRWYSLFWLFLVKPKSIIGTPIPNGTLGKWCFRERLLSARLTKFELHYFLLLKALVVDLPRGIVCVSLARVNTKRLNLISRVGTVVGLFTLLPAQGNDTFLFIYLDLGFRVLYWIRRGIVTRLWAVEQSFGFCF